LGFGVSKLTATIWTEEEKKEKKKVVFSVYLLPTPLLLLHLLLLHSLWRAERRTVDFTWSTVLEETYVTNTYTTRRQQRNTCTLRLASS
jgi:hypothetical protein